MLTFVVRSALFLNRTRWIVIRTGADWGLVGSFDTYRAADAFRVDLLAACQWHCLPTNPAHAIPTTPRMVDFRPALAFRTNTMQWVRDNRAVRLRETRMAVR